ncbi:F0F1 ATP synthase subunit delta [Cellulomonas fengjieae]|uniref:ATP synthase subunit delta n=1 Tax=Cellulomonas fengjieae TaxID=2819978 RepID=A0ABS3SKT8_9CELL|nr:F0F1 ATP synthase subunit delta [Cellulomonas fengjieae]MBO3086363.1 F0F1 ATP synthase subunit delta [Cellulomonas fengjieae]QVI66762.1 F0F1 ATP synthase subunit delta [Cellulomonas fengjieae]
MRGTSLASLGAVQLRFAPVLSAAGTTAVTLGEQLFAVVDALDSSGSLRRTLSDPAIQGGAKAGLVSGAFGRLDSRVVDVLSTAVQERWSSADDLIEAVERLGFDAVLASAQAGGELERVEDELFRITRSLVGQREVRQALFDPRVPGDKRADLAEDLLRGKVARATLVVARRAAASPRGRRFVATLGLVGELAAARRERLVAAVTSGSELSPAQLERLGQILQQSYGQDLQLNVTVDPEILGGMRIQVGADVVDSTVLAKLADARRRLAS